MAEAQGPSSRERTWNCVAFTSLGAGSALTIDAGFNLSNEWIIAGGTGLEGLALFGFVNNAFPETTKNVLMRAGFNSPMQPLPICGVLANGALTINGVIMTTQAVNQIVQDVLREEAQNVAELAVQHADKLDHPVMFGLAGLALILSNGAHYLSANLRGLNFFSRDPDKLPEDLAGTSAQGHGAYSMYGAAQIFLAGLALADKQLMAIGGLFLADGCIRTLNGPERLTDMLKSTKPFLMSFRPDIPACQLLGLVGTKFKRGPAEPSV